MENQASEKLFNLDLHIEYGKIHSQTNNEKQCFISIHSFVFLKNKRTKMPSQHFLDSFSHLPCTSYLYIMHLRHLNCFLYIAQMLLRMCIGNLSSNLFTGFLEIINSSYLYIRILSGYNCSRV